MDTKKKLVFAVLSAALLLLPGCGQGELQVFNDIKGDTYANSNLYAAGNFTYDAADIHAETLEQKSVFVSSHSGNFDCGSLNTDSINLSSSSGNITLERIEGNSLQMETASGKVEVSQAVLTDAISCISVSGNLNFDTLNTDRLAIDTTSANVDIGKLDCPNININSTSGKLKLALPESGVKLNFVTVSGSLKTSLPYETVGGLRVFGDGGSELNVVTISGNLELR